MITTGVTGRPWRASVTRWGAVEPWDGSDRLDWYVAADDRWHVPADEASVRQQRVDGTAVVETRVRVPNGDVVQRVYSVADAGGLTVVEVTNDSTLPVAIAFSHRAVRTERPIVELPIEGIELPADAFVLPVGHRALVRVAIAHSGAAAGALPATTSTADAVARGWTTLTDRASHFVLPDGEIGAGLAMAVTAHRCELTLGSVARAADDPAAFALGLGELVRMGEPADAWMPELVDAVEHLGPDTGWRAEVGLDAADRVLHAAGETRARRDLARITAGRVPVAGPLNAPGDVFDIAWLERRLAHRGELLPGGIPAAWRGANFEVHGVPVGPETTVSYAVRWHAERPAVLWETAGPGIELSAPAVDAGWRTEAAAGEALWAAQPPAAG